MDEADECLCTDSIVLKCKAVALLAMGHCFPVKNKISLCEIFMSNRGLVWSTCCIIKFWTPFTHLEEQM